MAFREGKGDEALLICKNCNKNFEIDAQFCTECGVSRLVALGVENSSVAEKNDTQSSFPAMPSFSLPKIKKPQISIKNNKFYLALTSIPYKVANKYILLNKWINERRKKFYAIAGVTAFLATYVVIQSIIFSTQKPDTFTQEYINALSTRDTSAISKDSRIFPNPEGLEILPAIFTKWREVSEISWNTNANWNGWLGTGKLHLTASTAGLSSVSIFSDPDFEVKLKAKFHTKYWIFRGIDWIAADPAPIVEIQKVKEADQTITLNREDAGTSNSPKLINKRYVTLAGPLEMTLDGTGFTKARNFSNFMTNGSVVTPNFENISYEMSAYQSSGAQSKLQALLNACLKRECKSLPYLGSYSFTFDNEPISYDFINYFNTSWGESSSCSNFKVYAITANSARISMDCSATAYAYIRWYLYRLFFTWYYRDGSAYRSFDFNVSATVKPSADSVVLSNFSID